MAATLTRGGSGATAIAIVTSTGAIERGRGSRAGSSRAV
jgi:hypothetical protein